MYSIFLIYSFIGGQLGHFHVLAIVTNAAINKGWMYLFGLVLSGYMPRSGIAGSYDTSIFSFLRGLWTVLHGGCTSLRLHQQCQRIASSPHPLQRLLFVGFSVIAILPSVRCLIVVVIQL